MKKFYVAFSIHGTNAFITASIETDKFKISKDGGKTFIINGRTFDTAESRRPGHNAEKDGQKLHHKALLRKDGQPTRNAPMIVSFFNTLAKEGWTVDKKAFVFKNWHR